MFTGIIEGTAPVEAWEPREQGKRMVCGIGSVAGELALGDSVAINGVCLTVVDRKEHSVAFDLAGETLRCTNLGGIGVAELVNFERSLRLGDRLDGHLVQGHVDGVGHIRELHPQGDDHWLEVAAPDEILQQVVFKGSVTVNGISLTVAKIAPGSFSCTIIPHTLAVTNLRRLSAGSSVNVEVDMVGKWVRKLVAEALPGVVAERNAH